MNRRDFLRVLLASAVAESLDVEKLLWTPKPIITVPSFSAGVIANWKDYTVELIEGEEMYPWPHLTPVTFTFSGVWDDRDTIGKSAADMIRSIYAKTP